MYHLASADATVPVPDAEPVRQVHMVLMAGGRESALTDRRHGHLHRLGSRHDRPSAPGGVSSVHVFSSGPHLRYGGGRGRWTSGPACGGLPDPHEATPRQPRGDSLGAMRAAPSPARR